MKTRNHPWLPIGGVLVCALLWGSAFPAIKLVYAHWAQQDLQTDLSDRLLFAGVRFIISGILLSPFIFKLRADLRTPRLLKGLLLLALFQTVGQYVFFYSGLVVSSGTLASLLVGTGSLSLVVISALMGHSQWPGKRQWTCIGLGASGVAVAVYAPGAGAGNPLLGASLLITANIFGAIGLLKYKSLSKELSARGATGFSLFVGGLFMFLLGISSIGKIGVLFDPYVMVMTLWLAFVSAAAFSLFNFLSTLVPINKLATYRFLVPICAMVESLILLTDETAGWGLLVGAVLVISSMIFVQERKPNP